MTEKTTQTIALLALLLKGVMERAPHASNRNYSTMEELPETLKAEIEALDSLDARALKRRYADIVADMPKCALSSVLRATIAYRLQERRYGLSLSKEATEWLDEAADDKRMFPDGRKVGSGARFVRFWKGERYETTVRDDGRYEYNGEIYSSLSAVAKAITGTHWNGRLFFGVK